MHKMKLALAALLLLLFALAGCQKEESFDIRGDWSFRRDAEEQFAFRFAGDRESGTLKDIRTDSGNGTYTVADTDVSFSFRSSLPGGLGCNFTGAFESEDVIKGNMEIVASYPPFLWTFAVVGVRLN